MKLDDLTETEQQALAGLIRLVVRLDGQFSPEEAIALAGIAPSLGGARFWNLLNRDAGLVDLESAKLLVDHVKRPDVRRWMFGVLEQVAKSDGIVKREQQLLTWLAERWELPRPPET